MPQSSSSLVSNQLVSLASHGQSQVQPTWLTRDVRDVDGADLAVLDPLGASSEELGIWQSVDIDSRVQGEACCCISPELRYEADAAGWARD